MRRAIKKRGGRGKKRGTKADTPGRRTGSGGRGGPNGGTAGRRRVRGACLQRSGGGDHPPTRPAVRRPRPARPPTPRDGRRSTTAGAARHDRGGSGDTGSLVAAAQLAVGAGRARVGDVRGAATARLGVTAVRRRRAPGTAAACRTRPSDGSGGGGGGGGGGRATHARRSRPMAAAALRTSPPPPPTPPGNPHQHHHLPATGCHRHCPQPISWRWGGGWREGAPDDGPATPGRGQSARPGLPPAAAGGGRDAIRPLTGVAT